MRIHIGLFLVLCALLSYPLQAMEGDDTTDIQRERTLGSSAATRLLAEDSSQKITVENTRFKRLVRRSQNFCYQVLARTCWDSIMKGFKPGRVLSMRALGIQPEDKVLLVGEGTGLDFEVLPAELNKHNLKAFDFSPQMVKQAKVKARLFDIPEENCFVGDAQRLPFEEAEKFDKIYFPLSLGSIPDPTLALQEAERVLSPRGKIVVMEKLVDDGYRPSCMRRFTNFFTQFVFADINRNLSQMMGRSSPLKIIDYQSLEGKLSGVFIKRIGAYYRIAVLVRATDYPDTPSQGAKLRESLKED